MADIHGNPNLKTKIEPHILAFNEVNKVCCMGNGMQCCTGGSKARVSESLSCGC